MKIQDSSLPLFSTTPVGNRRALGAPSGGVNAPFTSPLQQNGRFQLHRDTVTFGDTKDDDGAGEQPNRDRRLSDSGTALSDSDPEFTITPNQTGDPDSGVIQPHTPVNRVNATLANTTQLPRPGSSVNGHTPLDTEFEVDEAVISVNGVPVSTTNGTHTNGTGNGVHTTNGNGVYTNGHANGNGNGKLTGSIVRNGTASNGTGPQHVIGGTDEVADPPPVAPNLGETIIFPTQPPSDEEMAEALLTDGDALAAPNKILTGTATVDFVPNPNVTQDWKPALSRGAAAHIILQSNELHDEGGPIPGHSRFLGSGFPYEELTREKFDDSERMTGEDAPSKALALDLRKTIRAEGGKYALDNLPKLVELKATFMDAVNRTLKKTEGADPTAAELLNLQKHLPPPDSPTEDTDSTFAPSAQALELSKEVDGLLKATKPDYTKASDQLRRTLNQHRAQTVMHQLLKQAPFNENLAPIWSVVAPLPMNASSVLNQRHVAYRLAHFPSYSDEMLYPTPVQEAVTKVVKALGTLQDGLPKNPTDPRVADHAALTQAVDFFGRAQKELKEQDETVHGLSQAKAALIKLKKAMPDAADDVDKTYALVESARELYGEADAHVSQRVPMPNYSDDHPVMKAFEYLRDEYAVRFHADKLGIRQDEWLAKYNGDRVGYDNGQSLVVPRLSEAQLDRAAQSTGIDPIAAKKSRARARRVKWFDNMTAGLAAGLLAIVVPAAGALVWNAFASNSKDKGPDKTLTTGNTGLTPDIRPPQTIDPPIPRGPNPDELFAVALKDRKGMFLSAYSDKTGLQKLMPLESRRGQPIKRDLATAIKGLDDIGSPFIYDVTLAPSAAEVKGHRIPIDGIHLFTGGPGLAGSEDAQVIFLRGGAHVRVTPAKPGDKLEGIDLTVDPGPRYGDGDIKRRLFVNTRGVSGTIRTGNSAEFFGDDTWPATFEHLYPGQSSDLMQRLTPAALEAHEFDEIIIPNHNYHPSELFTPAELEKAAPIVSRTKGDGRSMTKFNYQMTLTAVRQGDKSLPAKDREAWIEQGPGGAGLSVKINWVEPDDLPKDWPRRKDGSPVGAVYTGWAPELNTDSFFNTKTPYFTGTTPTKVKPLVVHFNPRPDGKPVRVLHESDIPSSDPDLRRIDVRHTLVAQTQQPRLRKDDPAGGMVRSGGD